MKRILIIEDEYEEVKNAFEFINDIFFSGDIELINVIKSQDIPFHELKTFDIIFLDISLAKKSKMDGYGILKKIEAENLFNNNRIIIMTGNNKVSDVIKEREIQRDYAILTKPINFKELKFFLDEYIK